MEVEHKKIYWRRNFYFKSLPKVITISFVVAIAEVYKNEGNDEYNNNNFNSAVFFYTEGIKVNCKDEDLNAKLYSNRAAAHFNLGKKLLYIGCFKYPIFCLMQVYVM